MKFGLFLKLEKRLLIVSLMVNAKVAQSKMNVVAVGLWHTSNMEIF